VNHAASGLKDWFGKSTMNLCCRQRCPRHFARSRKLKTFSLRVLVFPGWYDPYNLSVDDSAFPGTL
jgi:hypothetical protein